MTQAIVLHGTLLLCHIVMKFDHLVTMLFVSVCEGDGRVEVVFDDDEHPLSIYTEHPKQCVR